MDTDGTIQSMDHEALRTSCNLFCQYKPEHFDNNMKNLKKVMQRGKTQVEFDTATLVQDRASYPKTATDIRGRKRWEGSKAEALLKQDVKDGLHKTFEWLELFWRHSAEYQEFEKEVFRKHVQQAYLWIVGRSY